MTSPVDNSMRNRKRRKEQEAKLKQQKITNEEENKSDDEMNMQECEEGMTSPTITNTKRIAK